MRLPGRHLTTLPLSVLILTLRVAAEIVEQTFPKTFAWTIDGIYEGDDLFLTCPRLKISVNTTSTSTSPPYSIHAYQPGEVPIFTDAGRDPAALLWSIQNNAVLLNVVDSAGHQGGIQAVPRNLIPSSCNSPTTPSHLMEPSNASNFTLSLNTTNPALCDPVLINLSGGTRPYNFTFAVEGDLEYTISTDSSDQLYTFVANAPPGSSVIVSAQDAFGRWAPSSGVIVQPPDSGEYNSSSPNQCHGFSDVLVPVSNAVNGSSTLGSPASDASGSGALSTQTPAPVLLSFRRLDLPISSSSGPPIRNKLPSTGTRTTTDASTQPMQSIPAGSSPTTAIEPQVAQQLQVSNLTPWIIIAVFCGTVLLLFGACVVLAIMKTRQRLRQRQIASTDLRNSFDMLETRDITFVPQSRTTSSSTLALPFFEDGVRAAYRSSHNMHRTSTTSLRTFSVDGLTGSSQLALIPLAHIPSHDPPPYDLVQSMP